MFRLMDRVSDGIAPMLKYLEDHIIHAGLADMMVAAELITQVSRVSAIGPFHFIPVSDCSFSFF